MHSSTKLLSNLLRLTEERIVPLTRAGVSTRDCIFFSTHEPSGFNEFYYLFTYEDNRDLVSNPHDIDILEQVFRVPGPSDTPETLAARPLYNRYNKFFASKSLADLLEAISDEVERKYWANEIARVKELYKSLDTTYQEGEKAGAESASVWK
ncbi:guanine deaminase [Chaetomidium leptoderma]|uniref:Guanine deaminase n=1 Tax=Chaetomidium leptoderma TaxID=669021 RepID=A0AAN6VPT6_9PEZI|nr:guanine deaminase [Chaetomidium leptoderma]